MNRINQYKIIQQKSFEVYQNKFDYYKNIFNNKLHNKYILDIQKNINSNILINNNSISLKNNLNLEEQFIDLYNISTNFYCNSLDFNDYLFMQKEALELFTKKNTDYGDAFATFGLIGVIIRLQDKINRIQSISKNNTILVTDESLKDTFIDLHNYSCMANILINF